MDGVKIKNNLDVCKAINEIENLDIKFIVIGKLDKDGEKIKQYDFVEYFEHLPHEEVMEKMRESDLYIQNSYFETFGLAVLEAVVCGCDILVSKNVGALSIIPNEKDSTIILDNENIEEIKNKLLLLKHEGNNEEIMKKIKNQNSWENSAKKLLKKVTNEKRESI